MFVEGLGSYRYNDGMGVERIGQGLGAAMFEFIVVADEVHLGAGYDLDGARRALRRMKPAHVATEVTQVIGTECAFPDTPSAIPNRAIPCS